MSRVPLITPAWVRDHALRPVNERFVEKNLVSLNRVILSPLWCPRRRPRHLCCQRVGASSILLGSLAIAVSAALARSATIIGAHAVLLGVFAVLWRISLRSWFLICLLAGVTSALIGVPSLLLGTSPASLLLLVFRPVVSAAAISFWAFSSPPDRLIASLRAWRCPAMVVEVFTLALYWLYRLLLRAGDLQLARMSRLLCRQPFQKQMIGSAEQLGALWLYGAESSKDLYWALQARGYTEIGRKRGGEAKSLWDFIFLAIVFAEIGWLYFG